MRNSQLCVLAMVGTFLASSAALAFEPGDRVVLIGTDSRLQTPQGQLQWVELGACYDVIQVEEEYAYVEGTNSGWILLEELIAPEDALEHFRKLAKGDPENLDYLVARVRVYCELEDYEPALEELTAAIQDTPEPRLYYFRGNVHVYMDRHDKAILDFKQAIELQAETPNLYRSLGRSYYHLGEYENALESVQKAIELDGMLAGDFMMCSEIYDKLDRQEDQLEYLIEAATLDSYNPLIQNNLAWLLATSSHDELRDGPRAIRHAMLACQLTNFADSYALDTLAAAYAEGGDFDRATRCAEQVLQLLPEGADTAEAEARLELYRQGQPYRDLPAEESDADSAEGPQP